MYNVLKHLLSINPLKYDTSLLDESEFKVNQDVIDTSI